jgi:sugar (pentulose or hexulose) kinase
VAFVERLGYERLGELGAPLDGPLRTAGAGSGSPVWTAIRATVVDVAIVRPESADTAFGACILAAAETLHESLAAATDAMVRTGDGATEPVAAERDRLETNYERLVSALRERGWLSWRK